MDSELLSQKDYNSRLINGIHVREKNSAKSLNRDISTDDYLSRKSAEVSTNKKNTLKKVMDQKQQYDSIRILNNKLESGLKGTKEYASSPSVDKIKNTDKKDKEIDKQVNNLQKTSKIFSDVIRELNKKYDISPGANNKREILKNVESTESDTIPMLLSKKQQNYEQAKQNINVKGKSYDDKNGTKVASDNKETKSLDNDNSAETSFYGDDVESLDLDFDFDNMFNDSKTVEPSNAGGEPKTSPYEDKDQLDLDFDVDNMFVGESAKYNTPKTHYRDEKSCYPKVWLAEKCKEINKIIKSEDKSIKVLDKTMKAFDKYLAIDSFNLDDEKDFMKEGYILRNAMDGLKGALKSPYISNDIKNKLAIIGKDLDAETGGNLNVLTKDEVLNDINQRVVDDKKDLISNISSLKGRTGISFKGVKKLPLFSHEPNINDLQQGGLGDCWLISGLTSIVNSNPKYIKDSMRDNGDGTVTVRLYNYKQHSQSDIEAYLSGLEKNVNYQDLKFKDRNNDTLQFKYYKIKKSVPRLFGGAGVYANCLWVQMMEKAFAIHRRETQNNTNSEELYGEVTGGSEAETIYTICGNLLPFVKRHIRYKPNALKEGEKPQELEDQYQKDANNGFGNNSNIRAIKMYKYIEKCLKANLPISAGSINTDKREEEREGIYSGHDYAILDCKEVNDVKYVLVRNPWGNSGRTYELNENMEIKSKDNDDNGQNKGLMWLEINDFINEFDQITKYSKAQLNNPTGNANVMSVEQSLAALNSIRKIN